MARGGFRLQSDDENRLSQLLSPLEKLKHSNKVSSNDKTLVSETIKFANDTYKHLDCHKIADDSMFGKSTELDTILLTHNKKVHELKKLLAKKPKSCKMDCRIKEHDDCKLRRNKTTQICNNRKKLLVGVNNYSVSVIAAVESRMGEAGKPLVDVGKLEEALRGAEKKTDAASTTRYLKRKRKAQNWVGGETYSQSLASLGMHGNGMCVLFYYKKEPVKLRTFNVSDKGVMSYVDDA
jgi:hypothetical protein